MNVRDTLHWSATFTILFSFFIIVSVVYTTVRVNTAIHAGRSADAIVKSAYDLNSLTDEYLARPSKRALDQWNAARVEIDQLLQEQHASSDEIKALLSTIRERSQSFGVIFSANSQGAAPALPALSERQAAQLKINSQAIVVDATRLSELNFAEQESSSRLAGIMLIFLTVVFTAGIVIMMVLLYRRITEPLSMLRGGADRIAGGDLAFRLGSVARDEFGQVARSFDEMADHLQELYRNLNKKAWAAEEVVSAQKEFIAVLSHELRNPLATLLSNVEIMQYEQENKDNTRKTLSVMQRNITAMRQLIDDLLEVSRITRDKISLKKEKIDLRDIVKDVVGATRSDGAKKQQTIKLTVSSDPCFVSADPVRMTQVLTNIVDNSIKFTPPKGFIEVNISREGADVVISVKDNGIGIRKEDMERIFEAFVQAVRDKSQKEGRGLGLGLKIVKNLVELHGGSIDVSSEGEGQGSEFIVRVPLLSA
ncbi:MAG TPA: HAMP domain-containing sensor histidine kinase [Candidatus Paceibacterota bacterium]|nr:HAMP domain-containing sensor histidine kinase [Candidatus Paceibacterota bacterium]